MVSASATAGSIIFSLSNSNTISDRPVCLNYTCSIEGHDYPYAEFRWCMENIDFDGYVWDCVYSSSPGLWYFRFTNAEDYARFVLVWK
jgi:hypothetical protein